MELLDPRIDEYISAVTPRSPSPLLEMEERAQGLDFPIIGPLVGRFLQQLVMMTGARNVFELGSGYGYSALWMAAALPPEGIVTCTDRSSANKKLAEDYFAQAGEGSKLRFHVGDALDIFAKERGPFDLVLNDIDKARYPDSIKLVRERLRPGGVFVTDNLLWGGDVISSTPDSDTKAIQRFTRELYSDPAFITTILPIRDGIAVAVHR
jgi:predicted O-methyltransferase YrrM